MNNQIPKFWTRLFNWLCDDDFAEELQGDLEERFYRDAENLGHQKAQSIYRKEVIKMIRPSVVGLQKRIPMLVRLSVFKIHFVLAIRNMVRNKTFSAVNVFGLGAAIAVCLFLVNMLVTGYTLDTQHKDYDRIYRVASYVERDIGNTLYASTSFPLTEKIRETIPDFEVVTQINTSFHPQAKVNGVAIEINGIYVDEHFFDLFNFKTIYGNPLEIFNDINSMAITEELADKLFPNENPIGKVTQGGFVIRAVLASPKGKSHILFEAITSLTAYDTNANRAYNSWKYFYQDYTYAKLRPNLEAVSTSEKLDNLSALINEFPDVSPIKYNYLLQPVQGILFAEIAMNDLSNGIGKETVYVFSILIFLMMFIASFNYTNLSIARAIQRTKEVGIRKVVGSTRWQIVSQFLLETIIFSFIALVIGFTIYRYASSSYVEAAPEFSVIFSTGLSVQVILIFFGFTLFSGILAGIFPAIFFSRITV